MVWRRGEWRFREVLALADGEPVGAAGCTLVDGVLRLWGGGVLEHARGRGAYRAMVAARCRFGADQGLHTAIVKARTATSAPIVRRVGFASVDVETCLTRQTTGQGR